MEGSDIPSIPFYERCFWNLCVDWDGGGFLVSLLCGLKTPCIIFPSVLWGRPGRGLHALGEGGPLRGLIILYLKPVWFGPRVEF